jgi:hypothetical protein
MSIPDIWRILNFNSQVLAQALLLNYSQLIPPCMRVNAARAAVGRLSAVPRGTRINNEFLFCCYTVSPDWIKKETASKTSVWGLPHSLQLGSWQYHTPANNRSRDRPTEYVSANHSARSYQAAGINIRVLAPINQGCLDEEWFEDDE